MGQGRPSWSRRPQRSRLNDEGAGCGSNLLGTHSSRMETARNAAVHWPRFAAACRRGLGATAVLLAACAGNAPAPAPIRPPAAAATAPEPRPVVHQPPQAVPALPQLGPEILLPAPGARDDEVARVGDVVLRKSDVYSRLASVDPKVALVAVDLLVFDALVAQHARQHGITVRAEQVDARVLAQERLVQERVTAELGGEMDFAGYVWRTFGMRVEDWRRANRLREAQSLYHGYVVRFLALREDRVRARFLVHKDRKLVQEVVEDVRTGAAFEALAQRHSEDASRQDGGLLPPFGRGFQHPAAAAAFTLQPGQVCEPFEAAYRGGQRWFAVYCLERLPGREATFAELRDELDRDLERQPLSPLEMTAYTLRWRGELEARPPEPVPDPATTTSRDR
jgi:parvulin-like peptidyl-prolyl isomerase